MPKPRTLARVLWVCAVLVMVGVVLAGCKKPATPEGGPATPPLAGKAAETAKPATPGGPVKIGFIVKMPEEPWFQLEWKFAQRCADEKGFELLKKSGTDGEKVANEISNLAAAGAQGFIICTPDQKLGQSIVDDAKRYNMKVIAVDDRFVGPDGKFIESVPYVGIAARKIGQAVGEALWAEFKKRGWDVNETACAAITYKSLETSRERTDGSTEALVKAGFPADKIYEATEKTTDTQGSMEAMNILLTQHPEVKKWLIFSMNDEGVLGAVRATEGVGFNGENTIGIGIGATTGATTDFAREQPTGFFAAELLDSYTHGYKTTEMMYEWITTGKEPPKETYTEGTLVNRDTYLQIMTEKDVL